MARKHKDVHAPETSAKTKEKSRRSNATNCNFQGACLPPEAVTDPLLRNSLSKFGKLSPLQQAKLNVVDCYARIESNRKEAAAFRKAASDPNCSEAVAEDFQHAADRLDVEEFGLGFKQRQAFSDVLVAAQVHATECRQTADTSTGKVSKRKYITWSKRVQKDVANLWNGCRENGGASRLIDCFEDAKRANQLPQCISSLPEFRACLEAARKRGLTHRVKRRRRKGAGKSSQ